jgi:putative (di)nucleoside polyphosphate hydrolase
MGGAQHSDTPVVGYRPCVGIFLLDRGQRRVFVGQRADVGGNAWQMPQGGIDPGEDPVVAARREMREEIGTDHATYLASSRVWRSYDLPPDLARRMWGGRYRGQTQLWLAFRFEGTDEEIRVDGEHPEFRAWQWIEPVWLPQVIVPFKRDVYLSVVDEFRDLWR